MIEEPFIPIAVWYGGGRARATMVQQPGPDVPQAWKQDLEQIKASGFNAIRCWLDWASGEPVPGRFEFRALDLLIDLAQEVGLRVIIQIYFDSAPDWPGTLYPDSCYVSNGGMPINSQGSPGYCYDHPDIRSAVERFLSVVARHVTYHPAFYAWDLWSEPHIVRWSYFDFLQEPALFCYCPYTVQRFRNWLQQKYGSLASLNAAWYRTYAYWDEVQPLAFIKVMTHTSLIDWLQFMMDKLAEDLRWRHEVIRQEDYHLTTSHSAVPPILTLPTSSHGSPDDWRMVGCVDLYGTSLYPKHVGATETNDPAFCAAMLTSTRSACQNRPYWLGELQGGHGYVGMFATEVTATDVRAYAWQCLAHGAKELNFYAWHPMRCGYESAGFGLINLDSTPSERALAAGEVARIVGANMELFSRTKPSQADAAICWNITANTLWASMREKSHYIPSRCYAGTYRALYQSHLPVDFVHIDQIAEGVLERYRVLYLPFSLALPASTGAKIQLFVEQGDVVLAEARTAWNDEAGACGTSIPGFGLEQVFACRERGATSVDENTLVQIHIVRSHPTLPLLQEGDVVSGALFREPLDPLTDHAEVIGEFDDGSPAIIVHRYGQGWALFVGSFLSLGYSRFSDANTAKLLQGLAQTAGIEAPVLVTIKPMDAAIETQLLEGTTGNGNQCAIFFALNYAAQLVEVHFAIKTPGEQCQMVDLFTNQPVPFRSDGSRLVLERQLEPYEIWIVKILEQRM